jgi:predicted MFS family arabinose efflux permease
MRENYGYKFTILIGLLSICIGVLMIPPISFFPQTIVTVIIGLFIEGIPGAFVACSSICVLIIILKEKTNLDDTTIHEISSAIYNLALNIGESIGPAMGGYVSRNVDFKASAITTSISAFTCSIIFFIFYFDEIKKKFLPRKDSSNDYQKHTGIYLGESLKL